MTVLAIYGGPLKSSIIKRAFGMCGQSVTDFELSPEEYELGLLSMNDLAAVIGSALGYNAPAHGSGSSDDESGLADEDVLGFTVQVAQEIAQNTGKAFTPNRSQSRALSGLVAKYQTVAFMQLGRQVPRGAGNRGMSPRYFVADVSDQEVVQ